MSSSPAGAPRRELLRELSLVLPAYDEEHGIERVLREARARLAERCARFEIVVVDDGSRDSTPARLAAAQREIPELVVVTQSRNLGYGAALARGFRVARFDPVLYTDADGQFDLADLDRAAPLLADGVDFVAGYRARRADPWTRRLASAGFNLLARLAIGIRARDVDCAFKLFRRRFLDATPLTSRGFLIDTELYARASIDGRRFAQLPVTHRPRAAGRSTVRLAAVWRSARELYELRRELARRPASPAAANSSAIAPAEAAGRSERLRRRALTAAAALLALALGLVGQGARGLGEPDEGRIVQIAQTMAASGDWWVPRLEGEVYLDKPPLTYWLVAVSLRLFGASELAARLPLALAFAATAALVGWLGALLWGARAGPWSALAYALSLGPFVGAAVLTPDTLLALASTLTAALFWRATRDGSGARHWLLVGAAAGAGLWIKGAAMLVFAAPLFVAESIHRRGLRWLAAPGPWLAVASALAVGLPWYVWIGTHLPDAARYFVSNQVTGRLFDRSYDRNPQASKVFTLYLPVLFAGALPWSLRWPGVALGHLRRALAGARRPPAAEEWFAGLWIALPFAVLCAARSRLPLYLLPLFAPLALLAGRSLAASAVAGAPVRRGRALRTSLAALLLGALWISALGALKLAAAARVDRRDGRRLAAWIAAAVRREPSSIWAIDADLHSLAFYGLPSAHPATAKDTPYPMYRPRPAFAPALEAEHPRSALLVTTLARLKDVRRSAARDRYVCRELARDPPLALLDCRRRGDSQASPRDAATPTISPARAGPRRSRRRPGDERLRAAHAASPPGAAPGG
jgi:4-amino-4-deoxy-L-arabinose transferase-like glycosyltransferase